jgi:uncharacterized protein YndB with AHSA1/START domain
VLKKIAIVVVVLIAALLAYAATRPDTFRVERSATIKAPPEKIFAILNDFQRWETWSPWEKKDPAMKRTLTVVTGGKGAVYSWEGNKEVGEGRMEIAESVPPSRLVIKLDFVKPFEAHNRVQFALAPQGDATNVTWAMEGDTPYLAKIVHVFLDMDKLVGRDFETGLANLKAVAEK